MIYPWSKRRPFNWSWVELWGVGINWVLTGGHAATNWQSNKLNKALVHARGDKSANYTKDRSGHNIKNKILGSIPIVCAINNRIMNKRKK